ncbi:MAG: hypothetical protein JXA73_14790 [Acidobacteria bacterium]|nr:hypothetical protein [Acidobacteriota bacterium]
MPKKIRVSCYGPIAVSRRYRSPWEDVFLSWTGKPGRRKYHLMLSLISRKVAERDHQEDTMSPVQSHDAKSSDLMRQSGPDIEAIALGKIHVIMNGSDNLPDVYTPKEYIDRAEAERMIAVVMRLHGFDSIRCKWKRPKFIITPV